MIMVLILVGFDVLIVTLRETIDPQTADTKIFDEEVKDFCYSQQHTYVTVKTSFLKMSNSD